MSAKKRRKRAQGTPTEPRPEEHCSVCGITVSKETAIVVKNIVYCLDAKCRPDLAALTGSPPELPPAPPPPDRSIRRLIVHSSVTIALCAVVFTMWIFREMSGLKSENHLLRSSRLALIEQLKVSNYELRQQTDTVLQTPPIDPILPVEKNINHMPRHIPSLQRQPTISHAPSNTTAHHFVNGSVTGRTVALTFDGGSQANVAETILDTLRSRSVKATMFLTGHFIRRYPDVTQQIVAAGHPCGNHTLTHPHLTTYATDRTNTTLPDINASRLTGELHRANELFQRTTGVHFAPIWRSPYGEYNSKLCRWAWEAGYLHIGWRQGRTWLLGLDSNDWVPDSTTPGFHTPEAFFDKVVHLARLQPDGISGGIILMHLGTERSDPAMQVHRVLGNLIDTLRAEGYRFVTIPEMVADAGIDLSAIARIQPLP